MKDIFDVQWPERTLPVIANDICRKYGITLDEFMGDNPEGKNSGTRPRDIVAAARAEFAYEAYKTGKHSLKSIGRFCRVRSRRATQIINRRVTAHCKKNGLERPKWGWRTEPWYRVLEND